MLNDFIIPDIELPQGIHLLFTTRLGGVSDSPFHSLNLSNRIDDDISAVEENRLRLSQQLPQAPQWLYQAHGDRVLCAQDIKQSDTEVADAVYTAQSNVVCAIQTADCLPIMLFSQDGKCVAAVHAGWRGLVAGVIQNTVKAMSQIIESPLYAYIGPHIHAKNYEIKVDVYKQLNISDDINTAFVANTHRQSWQVDLSKIATYHLNNCHVNVVGISQYCTYENNRLFYSVRRNSITGRQAGLIYRH